MPLIIEPSVATAKSWGRQSRRILRLNLSTCALSALAFLCALIHAVQTSDDYTASPTGFFGNNPSPLQVRVIYILLNVLTPLVAVMVALLSVDAWLHRHLSPKWSLAAGLVMVGGWATVLAFQTSFGPRGRWNVVRGYSQRDASTGAVVWISASTTRGIPILTAFYYIKLIAAGLALLSQFAEVVVAAIALREGRSARLVQESSQEAEASDDEA